MILFKRSLLPFALAAAVLFSACAAQTPASQVPSDSQNSSSDSSSLSQETSQADAVAEEDAETALASGMEIFGWFNFGGLNCDYQDTRTAENGWVYYRVTDERFPDYQSFVDYLGSVFSQEIVEELMSDRIFEDFDGALYSLDGARGANILIDGVEYSTKSVEENRIVYTASVTYIKDPAQTPPEVDHVQEYEFIREKTENGWIFTSFPYFY